MAGLPKEIYIVVAEENGAVGGGPIAFESEELDHKAAKEFQKRLGDKYGRTEIYKATRIEDPIQAGRVSDEAMKEYETWWYNEGSGDRQRPEEDLEEFVARMTQIAWSNGADKGKHR